MPGASKSGWRSPVAAIPPRPSCGSPRRKLMVRPPTDIAEWLTDRIAAALAVQPELIDRQRPLAEYGLDSVYALGLCGEIEEHLGLVVEPTLAWDYPTVTAIADHLRSELAREGGA